MYQGFQDVSPIEKNFYVNRGKKALLRPLSYSVKIPL